ncbi:MAG: SAM-dependent chlorinase/fluorinase [Crenarchaeota archaeon]|nr:SAM-dependent chlorinase/fluorinase [Thermoproteota archaeon]
MRPPCGVIGLLTDFGVKDVYVAAMKAVILSINPDAKIVDITHEVPKFSIRSGAFMLMGVYRYFPEGSVFVVVVDPGVGGGRRALLVVTHNYFFIGPDNGVLLPAAEEDGVEAVYELSNPVYMVHPVSASFHGRDIFSPAAAWLTRGVEPSSFGPRLRPEALVKPPRIRLLERAGDGVRVEVIHVDGFGNLVLSARWEEVSTALGGLRDGDRVRVRALCSGSEAVAVVKPVFSMAGRGELVLYRDSFGFAELAVNLGSAAAMLKAGEGCGILLSRA